jgi:hypothetical protein
MEAHEIPGRAGPWPGSAAPLSNEAPKPLQVLEKLPELAGNTNVTEVTVKGDPERAGSGRKKRQEDEKNRHFDAPD